MPLLNDYHELTLAAHYMPALVNNDYTGLDDAEAADLDAFMRDYWALPDATLGDIDFDTHFGFDEVSGLFGDCLTVKLYFTNETAPHQLALELN
jgi:hypothetical protein